MRQFVRGERAMLSELAAIKHLWEIELSVDAPVYIVDFCCMGLDENGELVDDDFIIHLNRPDAPRGAIQLNNASNNGAVFSLALEQLPPQIRRLVFTASVGENPLPGGILGAAFSLFGVNAEIGAGHLILATPAGEVAFFEFSGEDFGAERTLVIGELYLRDEWRFVAAGQPLKGEIGAFLRTLTDGPTPAPLPAPRAAPTPAPQRPAAPRPAPPTLAPPRPPRPTAPTPVRNAPRPNAPVLLPAPVAPVTPPAPRKNVTPLAPAPATITLPPVVVAAPTPVAAPAPPLNLPQSVPRGGKLQDLIDSAPIGSTLLLQRGEYQGPVVLSKPLVLEAAGSVIWARSGPVVTLASPLASLHDLDIEITISKNDASEAGVALRVEKAPDSLELDGVHLTGRLSGLGASDGKWLLPRALDLGTFAPRADNEFGFQIEVASDATLGCSVGGIEISPTRINAGVHRITLRARDLAPDTLLVGQIEVRAPGLLFIVPLHGAAQSGVEAARSREIGAL